MTQRRLIDIVEDLIKYKTGKEINEVGTVEKYDGLSLAIMSRINEDWIKTRKEDKYNRKAYYFSAEFLIGRSMGNNILNYGIYDEVKEALDKLKVSLGTIEDVEEDPALGNGGLGRLAACFMESAATENLPLQGYGVRYSQGLFKQSFQEGFQREEGDDWTALGDNWSVRRQADTKIVKFKDQMVYAVPYDSPVIGYRSGRVNTLRLWQAEAVDGFNFMKFNNFQYDDSMSAKNRAEDITRVLYPNDSQKAGKILRIKQQYFFVSASIQDMVARYKKNYPLDIKFKNFPKYHIIQLNDTHPVMAIPELMKVLMDENFLSWDDAWKITSEVFAFTNHTILEEAMEKWTEDILDTTNPRCLEIIREIDRRFKEELKRRGYSPETIDHLAIISNGLVKMANLAIYTSIKVNGVAKLHTEILKQETLRDWYELYPNKFLNKTNGITPRRWLLYSNPELASYITELFGDDSWTKDLSKLKDLEKYVDDEDVLDKIWEIKQNNKAKLARYIKSNEGIDIDPDSIFDIQVKRIHEYKRQLLNALHIVYLYHTIKEHPEIDIPKRTFIFGGKAAPGYFRAKSIIKFINEVAKLVNNDPVVSKKIKVVFVENFRVTYGEKIYPACDISEQISTAGKEASGTGNMKFMLNGALTLGTFDGANIEIFHEAGVENNFLFGAKVEELRQIEDTYNPRELYEKDPILKRTVDTLLSDEINDNGSYMFLEIYNALVNERNPYADNYFVLYDFHEYRKAHEKINEAYRDKRDWARKSLMNIANAGKFSSDRTIREYADEIWNI
ncbi:glycogen/starch/alpha-glucan phosphorylase [Lagierella sp.]|uniref:glycogen/starch/alpha-glucan phosphorylase n=1 Tax=Lagierella sp. TaxID=2849657 RepID=UPI0026262BA0|nr:glycogen/starch/alpha-glucan phosphorylase [Lagierella sp.]